MMVDFLLHHHWMLGQTAWLLEWQMKVWEEKLPTTTSALMSKIWATLR